MPYDPKTGKFIEEDSSMEKRVTGLISKNNPLMRQADTRGLQAAGRRGLMNSSMGVQAAQAAAYDAAIPIASQDASQIHQGNMQGRELQMGDITNKRSIASSQNIAGMQIAAQRGMHKESLAADKEARDQNYGFQREMADIDVNMKNLDREAQERIHNLNVVTGERQAASQMAVGFETTYATTVSNIMNNPELPADVRQQYLDNAAKTRDSNFRLVEQLYGIELNWGTAA